MTVYVGKQVDLFSTFFRAMDALYVFSDGDNHPDVVSVTAGDLRWSIVFLILSYVTVGLILMSYATAVMFDEYAQAQQDLVDESHREQQLNMFGTFAAITHDRYQQHEEGLLEDVNDKEFVQTMNTEQWRQVYRQVRPGDPREAEHASFLFELIDIDGGGSLDILEFCELATIITVDFFFVHELDAKKDGVWRFYDKWRETRVRVLKALHLGGLVKAARYMRMWVLDNVVLEEWFTKLIVVAIIVNTLFSMATLQFKQLSLEARFEYIQVSQEGIKILYICECVIKIFAQGAENYFSEGWSIFDFTLVLFSVPSYIPESVQQEAIGDETAIIVLRLFNLVRVVRLVKNIDRWKTFVTIFFRISPAMFKVRP